MPPFAMPGMPPMQSLMRRKRFEPREDAFSAFQQHAEETPTEQDYAPSLKRKLLAALAGGLTGLKDPSAGFELSSGIVQDPYRRAVSQHQLVGKQLLESMKAEQDQNEMMRLHANDEMDYEQAEFDRSSREQIRDADREARSKAAAEAVAARDRATGARGDAAAAETARKSASDKMIAAYRTRQNELRQQHENTYSRFADTSAARLNKPEEPMFPNRQEIVINLADQEVARDPMFGKYVAGQNMDGSVEFKYDKMPENIRKLLERARQQAQFKIANRRPSDFSPGSSEVLPEDVIDWPDDEEDEDFPDPFN